MYKVRQAAEQMQARAFIRQYFGQELTIKCPKCGAEPGADCEPNGRGRRRIGVWPYLYHKKRTTALLLGGPSTKSLTVPVRLSVLRARARVGPVDSAPKSQDPA